jgi:hypothetical protein
MTSFPMFSFSNRDAPIRIGVPSDDDRFYRLSTFIHYTMDKVETSFFTHRNAIPRRDDVLLAMLREWTERFDTLIIPLTFSHFGSLRIAELVHLHQIPLRLILCSASADLNERLALPLFDSYLDGRRIDSALERYVAPGFAIYASCWMDQGLPQETSTIIGQAIQAALGVEGRISRPDQIDLMISALITTQGCFTYDPHPGRHPEMAFRAGIMDYRSRIYLEDQIKQFPQGARQDEVNSWKQMQLTVIGNVTMSQDEIHISQVVGPVNVKAHEARVSKKLCEDLVEIWALPNVPQRLGMVHRDNAVELRCAAIPCRSVSKVGTNEGGNFTNCSASDGCRNHIADHHVAVRIELLEVVVPDPLTDWRVRPMWGLLWAA